MPWYGWIRKNNICTGIFKVLGSWPILVLWLLIVNVNVYHIATCFNALWNIPKRGSRINTDRFPKRSPKAQASNIRGSGGMLPWQFFEVLSPLSFPDRLLACSILLGWSLANRRTVSFLISSWKVFVGNKRNLNPNFQVVIMHALHVWSQHLFGLPVRMYGMHRTQFDDSRCNLLLLVIWSRKFDYAPFWPSVTWNFRKAQRWNKSILTFDHCRSSSLAYINLPENKRNKK